MNQHILGRGVIVCSAVVVTQWVPSFGVQLPAHLCQKKSELKPASPSDASQTTPSYRCALDGMRSFVEGLPEQFRLQWSQGKSPQVPHSMEREYQQLVKQAQTLASQNQIAEAIDLVAAIPKNTRYFNLAHQLQETWSQEILHQATSNYQQANLAAALKQLEAIPVTSSQYAQVAQLKHNWQQHTNQLQRAIVASKAGRWQEVTDRLEAIKNTPLFQSLPVQELLQIAMARMLEPDSNLMQIASTMDSTQFSTASLPQSSSYSRSLPSLPASPAPLSFPVSSNFNSVANRIPPSSANSSLSAKLSKSDRLAMIPQPAPSKREDVSAKIDQFGSAPSTTSSSIPVPDKLTYVQ